MKANTLTNIGQEKRTRMTVYWCLFAVLIGLLLSMQQVFAATDLFDAASKIAKEYFGQITALSTILAACVIVTALVLRMFTKNERAIAAWTNWAKVAGISWLIIMFLQVIMLYAKDTIEGAVGNAALW